jgi:putative endonuclease
VSGAAEGPPHFAFALVFVFTSIIEPPKNCVIRTEAKRSGGPGIFHQELRYLIVEQAYVYILANTFQRLYIGITTEIETRIAQHKSGFYPDSFTTRYKIDKLVYVERLARIPEAIAREKQLKNWSRIKKLRLIVAQNPTWQDLSVEWGKPISSS